MPLHVDRTSIQTHQSRGEHVLELAAARALPNVRAHVDGTTVVKEIVVPDRLVNIVVK